MASRAIVGAVLFELCEEFHVAPGRLSEQRFETYMQALASYDDATVREAGARARAKGRAMPTPARLAAYAEEIDARARHVQGDWASYRVDAEGRMYADAPNNPYRLALKRESKGDEAPQRLPYKDD